MNTGSSPRVRGAVRDQARNGHRSGIIPARAGSRCIALVKLPRVWDHPRACGEQASRCAAFRSLSGSSPRVRGAVLSVGYLLDKCGIIPARAGSSNDNFAILIADGDHPRACGEQLTMDPEGDSSKGSSPRVRGAAPRALVASSPLGIIPARAGSSGMRACC